jgi:uncharacterized protein
MLFVNRRDELDVLAQWYGRQGARLGLVWGRRRVGKTASLQEFARDRRHIFHTAAGRPAVDELRALSTSAALVLDATFGDLRERPFTDWNDAIDTLASTAQEQPLLLVHDEFPELLSASPELAGVLRAAWDRVRTHGLWPNPWRRRLGGVAARARGSDAPEGLAAAHHGSRTTAR